MDEGKKRNREEGIERLREEMEDGREKGRKGRMEGTKEGGGLEGRS